MGLRTGFRSWSQRYVISKGPNDNFYTGERFHDVLISYMFSICSASWNMLITIKYKDCRDMIYVGMHAPPRRWSLSAHSNSCWAVLNYLTSTVANISHVRQRRHLVATDRRRLCDVSDDRRTRLVGGQNQPCLAQPTGTRVSLLQLKPSRTAANTKHCPLIYASPHHQLHRHRCCQPSSTRFSSRRPRGSQRSRSDFRASRTSARCELLLPCWITPTGACHRQLIASRRQRQTDHRRLMSWINNITWKPWRRGTADVWYIVP